MNVMTIHQLGCAAGDAVTSEKWHCVSSRLAFNQRG
jgi:hypothetical protein